MQPPVGAGLLAKAVCQSTEMLNGPAPSRASPLPQGYVFTIEYQEGELFHDSAAPRRDYRW
ncbi:hypothetical protein ABH909_000033 [Pseudomonas sp. BS3782 TE3695]